MVKITLEFDGKKKHRKSDIHKSANKISGLIVMFCSVFGIFTKPIFLNSAMIFEFIGIMFLFSFVGLLIYISSYKNYSRILDEIILGSGIFTILTFLVLYFGM